MARSCSASAWGTSFLAMAMAAMVASMALGCKKRQKGPPFQAEDLAVGGAHACALMKNGFVRCWGKNDVGQLGDKGTEDHTRPIRLEGLPHVTELFAGRTMVCGLVDDGASVTCWGAPAGLSAALGSLHDVLELAIGRTHACARMKTGTIACGGETSLASGDGGLGGGLVPVAGLERVLTVAVGAEHTCAVLQDDGTVHCWGKNDAGQLGDGTTTARTAPTRVPGLRGVIQLAAGDAHTCATLADRTVSCWGSNRHGQLGDGTRVDRHVPTPVVQLESARAVALGDANSCARLYDGTLRCWGQNDAGQQNDGTKTDRVAPGMISGLFNVQQIGLGEGTVCARLSDGFVRCWGRNGHGQAGDGTRAERPVPVTVRW